VPSTPRATRAPPTPPEAIHDPFSPHRTSRLRAAPTPSHPLAAPAGTAIRTPALPPAPHRALRTSTPRRHHHVGGAESGPSLACGTTLHHSQLPRSVGFAGAWVVPALRGELSCTAAKYSNEADQHRPRTSSNDQRPAETTPIECPARSSGRRGRGFKSRHPDALKRQVSGLFRWVHDQLLVSKSGGTAAKYSCSG
jgi:hypothetical protein